MLHIITNTSKKSDRDVRAFRNAAFIGAGVFEPGIAESIPYPYPKGKEPRSSTAR